MRIALLALLMFSCTTRAGAEGQIRPFVGATFAGDSNLLGDFDFAVGKRKTTIGIAAGVIGEVLGVEIDLARTPGFFQTGRGGLVLKSSLTTLTSNLTIALPRRMTEYTLRPYLVGGAGLMRTRTNTVAEVFELSKNRAAVDLGGGVTGFITRRLGVTWDVRHFRTFHGKRQGAATTDAGPEQLSFWRANMALAIRY